MSKAIAGILIDPLDQSVSRIMLAVNRHNVDLNTPLSFVGHVCIDVEGVGIGRGDSLYVDGLAAIDARLPWFYLNATAGQVQLYGRAIIIGAKRNGNPCDARYDVDAISNVIEWPDKSRSVAWKLSDGRFVPPHPAAVPVGDGGFYYTVETTDEELVRRMLGS